MSQFPCLKKELPLRELYMRDLERSPPSAYLSCGEESSLPENGPQVSLTPLPASTARHLYLRGGAGVGSMTKIYGGRQRNGVMPSHFSRGSKSVARRVLQALEGLKMVEKDQDG